MAVTATTAAWGWTNDLSLNDSERHLFDRLDRVVASGNPSPSDIIQAFGLPPACAQGDCSFQQPEAANPGFSSGNLRSGDYGLIFELVIPRGQCIRVDRVDAHFGQSELRNQCAHNECWLLETRHEWGLLAFGLQSPTSPCVASVLINTGSDERLHVQGL